MFTTHKMRVIILDRKLKTGVKRVQLNVLTQEQLTIVEQSVKNSAIRKKLINYVSTHAMVKKEIFQLIGNDRISKKFSYRFKPVKYDVFLRRLPIYFYSPGRDLKNFADFSFYASNLDEDFYSPLYSERIEELYSTVERLYYHHQLDLRTIFNYPLGQEGQATKGQFLFQWKHYLDLVEQQGGAKKTPEHFIVDYNYALEKAKLKPIVYEIQEQFIGEYFHRNGNIFRIQGVFPCDEKGNPILRWIGVNIVNPTKIWVKIDKKLKGFLYVEANEKTAIYGLNCWGTNDDGSDCWYRLYAGPLLLDFDYSKLKPLRLQAKLTQKQVAEAIGSVERTYQKWESGTTTPDCHYLLRLMNILDIRSVNELTKINLTE